MISGDPLQVETESEAIRRDDDAEMPSAAENRRNQGSEGPENSTEERDDDAWMDACRTELDDQEPEESDPVAPDAEATDAELTEFETPGSDSDAGQNEADLGDSAGVEQVIEKTGDDAMSKFGHAIGALAERDEDLDDQAHEYASEAHAPSSSRDAAVAPHIAAAERELERTKSSGPVDIFDRIAQAAESEFDESRGNTAKRVSELVDDRRVGTKRWTPSKTMKKRMEKLEAARAAAAGPVANGSAPTADANTEKPAVAASAPMSSAATMVSPDSKKKAAPQPVAESPPMTEEQSVTISRRSRHPDAAEDTATESAGAAEADIADEEELDADGLRVIPGARGRRRDRARKSRLDEDFEKIFDDEGTPTINSLRRKLRSGAKAEAPEGDVAVDQPEADVSAVAADTVEPAQKKGLFSRLRSKGSKSAAVAEIQADEALETASTVTEEHFGAEDAQPAKKGLFSSLLKSKKPRAAPVPVDDEDEDDLVAAFEANDSPLPDAVSVESDEDDDWQAVVDSERKSKSNITMPLIGGGAFIALGLLGWFGYKMLFGG